MGRNLTYDLGPASGWRVLLAPNGGFSVSPGF